ncbi:MAG: hypothetical protein ABWZ74_09445 [Hyphomicrobiaceae bacterium]|jgi:hypothetical protein
MGGPNLRLEIISDQARTSDGLEVPGNTPSSSDRLEYMADLILQLRSMADNHGYTALGGILEVAYQEAKSLARMR